MTDVIFHSDTFPFFTLTRLAPFEGFLVLFLLETCGYIFLTCLSALQVSSLLSVLVSRAASCWPDVALTIVAVPKPCES